MIELKIDEAGWIVIIEDGLQWCNEIGLPLWFETEDDAKAFAYVAKGVIPQMRDDE